MPDIAEQICLAVDQIVNKRLESIKYDTTITAVIVDNSKAKDNQYTCSNGEAEFIAYSKDTSYKINESVQVTIPNNDYSQQKVIIGRYVVKDDKPFEFTQPFDTIIDVSSNLIIGNENPISASLLANEDYDDAVFNADSKTYSITPKETVLWSEFFKDGYSQFTRLGLQGQFRSWISSLKPVEGSYGYRLEVFSENGAIVTNNTLAREWLMMYQNILKEINYSEEDFDDLLQSTPDSWYTNIALSLDLNPNDITRDTFTYDCKKAQPFSERRRDLVYSLIYANFQVTDLLLDSTEMYGNPYNFQAFFQQEKVYDVSTLGKIYGFVLYFYEKSGSFYNEDYEYLPYCNLMRQKFNDNLFTKDPYICLGYDLGSFSEEQAILYTLDGDTYIIDDNIDPAINNKHIRLRWLHEFENGDIEVINEKSNISNYEIRWYRYKLGAPSPDEYSGVYWQRVNDSHVETEYIPLDEINNLRKFYLLFHLLDNGNGATEYTYMNTFCPEYKDYDTTNRPMSSSSYYSYMGYWTDECLKQYGIPDSLAQHSFAGNRTTTITKYVDQTWMDIFNYGFVYHNNQYSYRDYITNSTFPVRSGCMHRVGFWEKFTLAYRLYWVYPDAFRTLLGNKDVWRYGGVQPTGKYDRFGNWDDARGKNPYSDFGYYYDGNYHFSSEDYATRYKLNDNTAMMRYLFAVFADSFGEWTYVTDKYGMKDYVPADEGVRNHLFDCLKTFYEKLDNPVYEKRTVIHPFSYILEPAVNEQMEQVKVIILHDGKVIRSNVLTFTNEKEVASKATADLVNGLSVWCEDNSYGNYYIYGQNNNLFDETKANEILTLSAKFIDKSILSDNSKDIDVAEEAPDLVEAKSIIWEFPLKHTMIVVHGFDYNFDSKIRQAVKSSNSIINGINYSNCLENNSVNTTKISEIDPEGKIFKLNGYFTDPEETIRVIGNTIYITRKGDPNNANAINNKQTYRINKTYNATSINNTVKCTVSKNSLNYATTKEMSFGLMGTNGTDATIVIDFDENKTALTAGLDESETIKVIAHLYDFNHNEVDFNNSDLNLSCRWEWLYNLGANQIAIEQRENYDAATNKWVVTNDTISPNACLLSYGPNLSINNDTFLILKVTVLGFGDYDLISYKAIPIRASRNYRNLIGATEVLYSSSGHADYYKSPYELLYCDIVNQYDMPESEIVTLDNKDLSWNIYSPYKKSEEENKFYGDISKENILQPLLIYTKGADPYGVICLDSEGNRLWIQPLVILQNEYPSSTLNKWDGKSVEINYENGTIVAPAISAGKKNDDNTFSGVMLGDWSTTDTAGDISQQTGVYGFHHGAMSYAFKEDGTAFIGKSGLGRILFNGNSGTITSSAWDLNDTSKSEGLFMDLDDGILKMQANRNYNRVSSPKESNFDSYYINLQYQPVALDATYNPNTTYYTPSKYSANHSGSSTYIRYFYYQKEGETTYTKATSFDTNLSGKYFFPIQFDAVHFTQAPTQEQLINYFIRLDTGYIKARYNEESGSGLGLNYNSTDFQYYNAGEKGYITLSADEDTYPLGIGMSDSIAMRNFRVRWDGTCYITDGIFSGIVTADELYCDYGFIGGWEISASSLSGGKTVLDSYDGIFTNRVGIIDAISSANNDGLLGEIGLVQGADEHGATTYNIGIVSRNQSIILDTFSATGSTANIAFRSKGGTWAQCSNFYVMGNSGGWMSKNESVQIHTNKLIVSTPAPENQTGIYARFA